MGRIDLRKFDDVRHLVRARLLSSEFHDLEKIAKEHVAADVWKTYYLSLPTPDGFAPWDITYSLLEEWPGVTIDVLSVVAEENEAGTQTMMKMSEVLQAYLDTPPWDDSPAMYVVTTKGSYCGASAVLDTDIQRKLGEVFPKAAISCLRPSMSVWPYLLIWMCTHLPIWCMTSTGPKSLSRTDCLIMFSG